MATFQILVEKAVSTSFNLEIAHPTVCSWPVCKGTYMSAFVIITHKDINKYIVFWLNKALTETIMNTIKLFQENNACPYIHTYISYINWTYYWLDITAYPITAYVLQITAYSLWAKHKDWRMGYTFIV